MSKPKVHRPVAADFKISSPFGPRTHPTSGQLGRMHYGIDLAVPEGTPVVASIKGLVQLAGWQSEKDHNVGFGFRVWQKESERDIFVVYAHLSVIEVKEGQLVEAGQRIGLSGNTGDSSGPHLHHELRIGGIAGVKGSSFGYVEDVA